MVTGHDSQRKANPPQPGVGRTRAVRGRLYRECCSYWTEKASACQGQRHNIANIQQEQVFQKEVHGVVEFGFDEDGSQNAEIASYSSYRREKEMVKRMGWSLRQAQQDTISDD